MKNEPLDEKGFVFLDAANRPFQCRMIGDESWVCYWCKDHWVSLRKVTQIEIWGFPHNLKQEWQDVYHKQHEEYLAQFASFESLTR